jgi:hypothetical protein
MTRTFLDSMIGGAAYAARREAIKQLESAIRRLDLSSFRRAVSDICRAEREIWPAACPPLRGKCACRCHQLAQSAIERVTNGKEIVWLMQPPDPAMLHQHTSGFATPHGGADAPR